jgi:collagen type III alpha
MPALLQSPKPAGKHEEFVQKQIESARGRIRLLDFFSTGLALLIGTLAFTIAVLLIDRYVETPKGSGRGIVALFVLGAAGYIYWALFRPSRRKINPFYAARKVEQTIADAKNSVVNFVDLKDDESVPASVKTAIGAKAAKDLKQVDLNQAIQKRQILWLGGVAAVFFLAALVVVFLPPTRTSMELLRPKEGNDSVLQGVDFRIEVELKGRIPKKGDPDVARARIWYNPEDPDNYEERPLEIDETQKNVYGVTIPAKQVRNGFHYKLLAGNVQTPAYEVKLRIIPQFTGWEVQYQYPDYLKRPVEKTNDPNLVGYYGTQATVTAFTNKSVRSGVIEDDQGASIAGQLVDGNPEAIRFQFPMMKNGAYRIIFVTTEGEKNSAPQKYRISLMDPNPTFLNYEVTFDYPKYRRWKPETVTLREPHLEALRGTMVKLVANANRPIKRRAPDQLEAKLQFQGQDQPIVGEPVKDQPMQVKFTLPPLMKDGAYRVAFSPATTERDSDPRVFNIRVIGDEKPKVSISSPQPQEIELPANGILSVEGEATDDIGLAKMNLRMQVVSPGQPIDLAPKPYRNGMSFRRDSDNSYPTRIDYKDFAELAKIKPEGEAAAGFQLQPGMIVEYWLEAIDNCDVPPGPNIGLSDKKRVKIAAPLTPEQKQKQKEQQQKLERDKQQHDQRQDQKNANEKRDPKQEPRKGDQQAQRQGGAQDPDAAKTDPKNGGKEGDEMQPMGDPQEQQDLDNNAEKVQQALNRSGAGGKSDPSNTRPPETPKGEPKGGMAADMNTDPKQLPKPEDFEKLAEKLDSKDPMEREQAREQLKQMMEQTQKNPPKPDDQKKKVDEHRKDLNQEQKGKFDKAMEKLQNEMKDIKREEKLEQAAEKAKSNDPEERKQGQEQLQDLLKDQENGSKNEEELQRLEGKETNKERKQRLDDAIRLSKENLKKKEGPPQPPKPNEEEDVDKLAKKADKGKEKEKQDAREKLEKKLQDPKQREQVQKQLDDYRKSLKTEQEKQEFDKTMRQMREDIAKKPKAEDIQKLAQQLQSDNKSERDQAQKQLEETMKQADKDPKAREQAQKQIEQIRDNIKDQAKKDQFDQAMKQIDKSVQQHRDQRAQAQKDAVDKLAKDLNSPDQAKQQAAQRDLEKMLQDPQNRDAVKEQLEKSTQGMDQQAKKHVADAVKQAEKNIAKKDGGGTGTPKKEDVDKLANELSSGDPAKRQEAQQKLEEMLNDPKNKEAVKEQLEKAKKNMGAQARKDIDNAVRQAEKNIAKKDGDDKLPTPQDIERLAKLMKNGTPQQREAMKKQIEESMKKLEDHPEQRGDGKKKLEEVRNSITDPKQREEFDKNLKDITDETAKMRDQVVEERSKKIADDLNSKDPRKQQAAQDQLDKMLKDPEKRQAVQDHMQKFKEGQKDETARKNIDEAMKRAEENLAKGGPLKADDIAKMAKKLQSGTPQERQRAQRDLEKLLNDPETRDQVEKQLEQIKNGTQDARAKKALEDAIKEARDAVAKQEPKKEGVPKVDPKEIAKLADKMLNGTPEQKRQSQGQIEDLMQNPKTGEAVAKELQEFRKSLKNDQARKDFDKKMEEIFKSLAKKDTEPTGEPTGKLTDNGKRPASENSKPDQPGALADLKNKAKAGELLLEKFEKNLTNEEFRKQLGWTDEQIAAFRKKYEQQLAKLKKEIDLSERGELPDPRQKGPSSLDRAGPERADPGGNDLGNPSQSGRFIAPPGFGDSYKRFTEEASGVRTPPPKK